MHESKSGSNRGAKITNSNESGPAGSSGFRADNQYSMEDEING